MHLYVLTDGDGRQFAVKAADVTAAARAVAHDIYDRPDWASVTAEDIDLTAAPVPAGVGATAVELVVE